MITGQCFCSKIKYKITAPIIKSGICHCLDCQRLTGGSSWPFIIVPSNSLYTEGIFKEISRTGSSGKKVHVGFCSVCGTTLFGKPELWPHIRTISVSSLDDRTLHIPNMHVWVKDAAPWVLFDAKTPQFDKNPK